VENNNIYSIYHPLGGEMNHNCDRHKFQYDFIDFVQAQSLSEAFKLGQNDFNLNYRDLGFRSTSVGDIIVDPSGKHYRVKGVGFEEIPPSVLLYHVKEFSKSWAQMVLDHPEDFGLR
jgi:hypothetical protein